MTKSEVLAGLSFGKRIAEEETKELAKYFVKTDQWQKLRSNEVDVIYGPKGSGKSALYALLYQEEDSLFDEGVLVIPAENTRGAPAFRDITVDPPPGQSEFVGLWKLYLLSLIGRKLRDLDARGADASSLYRALEEAKLLDRELSLQGLLSLVSAAIAKHFFRPEGIEGGVKLDPTTGVPIGITAKIIFSEPTLPQRGAGFKSVDQLFANADSALGTIKYRAWLLLDRLDVAFAETPDLERNALRALFQAYLDLRVHDHVSLKIFLRTDIWNRITQRGFLEASHITRHLTIEWDATSLLNLVIRRFLANAQIAKYFRVNPEEVLADLDQQRALFYRAFPKQVDSGPNKPTTFDWMLSRTRDGTGLSAPREMIHLLNSIRDTQVRKLETGDEEPVDENLFGRAAIKDGLREVSNVRRRRHFTPSIQHLSLAWSHCAERRLNRLSAVWRAFGNLVRRIR